MHCIYGARNKLEKWGNLLGNSVHIFCVLADGHYGIYNTVIATICMYNSYFMYYSCSYCVCRTLPRILYNSLLRVHSRHAQLPGTGWFTLRSLSWDIKHPVQRSRVGYFGVLPGKDLDGKSTVPRCPGIKGTKGGRKKIKQKFKRISVPILR